MRNTTDEDKNPIFTDAIRTIVSTLVFFSYIAYFYYSKAVWAQLDSQVHLAF